MTRQRNDSHSTEFGLWLRQQKSINSSKFDAQNLDYIWFAYRNGWLLIIEEKRYNSKQALAQKDTHSLIDQMLQFASGNKFNTKRGKRNIEYRGYFLIQFEKTNPDDSKWIKINGYMHTKEDLLNLLQTGHLIDFEKLRQEYPSVDDLPFPIQLAEWNKIK